MSKILLVVDCIIDARFINAIEKRLSIEVDTCIVDSSVDVGKRIVLRHVSYFIASVKAFRKRKKYSYIIFWQQFIGFYYGLISRFFSNSAFPVSVTFPLIYKQRKGMWGDVYKRIYASMLKPFSLKHFICFSSSERDFYSKMFGLERRIAYIPCGPSGIPEETGGAQIVKGHAPYIFSGGTSNRDYKTLISAFKENNEKLKILCNVKDVEGIEVPANVEILHDIHGEAFIDYMRNAYAVVIPIDNDMISSGQLVLLQAMSLKKPIIITRSAGVTDYADENCVLFVESHSVFGIRDAVSLLLNDRDVANQLAQNAHKRYKDNFTIEQFGERIADLLKGEFCL